MKGGKMKKGIKILTFVLSAIFITTLLCISILHFNKDYTQSDIEIAYANGLTVGEIASEEALSGLRTEYISADEKLRTEFSYANEELKTELSSADEELRSLINSSSDKYYNHYIFINFNHAQIEELGIYSTIEVAFNVISKNSEAFTIESLYDYLALNFNDLNKRYINGNSDTVYTANAGLITEKKLCANTNLKQIKVQFQLVNFSIEDGVLKSQGSIASYYVTNETTIRDIVIEIV